METSESGSVQFTLVVDGTTSYEADLSISVHSPNGQGMLSKSSVYISIYTFYSTVVPDVYLVEPNITIPAYTTFVIGYTVYIISDDILEYDGDIVLMITGYDRVNGGENATVTIFNDDGQCTCFNIMLRV